MVRKQCPDVFAPRVWSTSDERWEIDRFQTDASADCVLVQRINKHSLFLSVSISLTVIYLNFSGVIIFLIGVKIKGGANIYTKVQAEIVSVFQLFSQVRIFIVFYLQIRIFSTLSSRDFNRIYQIYRVSHRYFTKNVMSIEIKFVIKVFDKISIKICLCIGTVITYRKTF